MISTAINQLLGAIGLPNATIGFATVPQGVDAPYVIHSPIDRTAERSKDGIEIMSHNYEIVIIHTGAVLAQQMADDIREALEGATGTIDSTVIDRIWYVSEIFEGINRDEDDNPWYIISQTYNIRELWQ